MDQERASMIFLTDRMKAVCFTCVYKGLVIIQWWVYLVWLDDGEDELSTETEYFIKLRMV